MYMLIFILMFILGQTKGQENCSSSYEITSFNLTYSDGTFDLNWTTDDTEGCIDHFQILITPSNGGTHITINMRGPQGFKLIIPNMQDCVTYFFALSAVTTDDGWFGTTSTRIYTVSGVVTSAPRLGSIIQGSRYINTTWNFDDFSTNSCPITGVLIESAGNFNLSLPVKDSTKRPPFPIDFINLDPNKVYLSSISVINEAGISPPFVVALQTLPEGNEE